ncbi:MAG: DUF1328 family protein [Bacteroidota bacterium]
MAQIFIIRGENIVELIKLYFMLRWSASFFLVAIVAAIFGFGGIASGITSLAKVLFFLFILLFLLSLFFKRSSAS